MTGEELKERFYKPTPRKVKRALLAFKGLIGSISGLALIQNNPYWAAGILIAGAITETIVKLMSNEEEEPQL